jgi:hypothetical protein
MDMKNEKGFAIAMVLLVLAVVSLVGAGLLLQSRFDTKFTHAQKNYDRSFGMADSAASYAFPEILAKDTVGFKGGPTVIWGKKIYMPVTPGPPAVVDLTAPAPSGAYLGTAVARAIIQGYDTDPSQVAGYELGTAEGYHAQFWIAEGLGIRTVGTGTRESGIVSNAADTIPPEEAVFMAAKKFAKN